MDLATEEYLPGLCSQCQVMGFYSLASPRPRPLTLVYDLNQATRLARTAIAIDIID